MAIAFEATMSSACTADVEEPLLQGYASPVQSYANPVGRHLQLAGDLQNAGILEVHTAQHG